MNKKLEELINYMPVFKEITGKDAEINIWDLEGINIGHFPSKSLTLPFKVGFHITDRTDPIFDVMKTGKQRYVAVPSQVFGVSIEGYITPIFDDNKVVGCSTYVFSSEYNEKLTTHSETLQDSVSNTAQCLSEVSLGIHNLTNCINEIHNISTNINDELGSVQNIVTDIQKNAGKSTILALNASIESARAGEAGKGFAVVSDEMRKFSKSSSDSAKMISDTLTSITNSLNEICDAINKSTSIANNQTMHVETVNNTFEHISSLTTSLVEFCKMSEH